MKTAIFGLVIAALILASAIAHAVLGWPAMASALAAHSVDGDLLGALAAGWHFGSVSMSAFSLIIAAQAFRLWKGARPDILTLAAIAIAYVLFGAAAFILRDFNPHFLLFTVTGVLIAAFALLGRKNPSGPFPDSPAQ